MNRVVGIETEYGCLNNAERGHGLDPWPARVKNHAFHKSKLGAIDRHYRDYEEPPGNGGFLLNGGRLYMDMGHLEYSSPESLSLHDAVAYDVAGDLILQSVLEDLGMAEEVAFLRNNIDHYTGATFGCHENFLMHRRLQFHAPVLRTLLSFLATRQIFTGAGRVGQANPLAMEFEPSKHRPKIDFQLSQRADHIVNDHYPWVQFNRAIINARDEPLADPRKYWRLHLLIGDSNVSPFATALKIGTTALLLTLLEEGVLPKDVILRDAVLATRQISHEGTGHGAILLEDGRSRDALDIQEEFLACARQHLAARDVETDWILENWAFTLEKLRNDPQRLIGGVDWISKKWLLDTFRESEGVDWHDPWIQSLDLEYHNINPAKGLFFALNPPKAIADFNASVRRAETVFSAPKNTRAFGRALAVRHFQSHELPYVINWDSIAIQMEDSLTMPDPFKTYEPEIAAMLEKR